MFTHAITTLLADAKRWAGGNPHIAGSCLKAAEILQQVQDGTHEVVPKGVNRNVLTSDASLGEPGDAPVNARPDINIVET